MYKWRLQHPDYFMNNFTHRKRGLSCNSTGTGTPVQWHPTELGSIQAMLGLMAS